MSDLITQGLGGSGTLITQGLGVSGSSSTNTDTGQGEGQSLPDQPTIASGDTGQGEGQSLPDAPTNNNGTVNITLANDQIINIILDISDVTVIVFDDFIGTR